MQFLPKTLKHLFELDLRNNNIVTVPMSIMNHRKLYRLIIDCDIDPIINRFLDRNTVIGGSPWWMDSKG